MATIFYSMAGEGRGHATRVSAIVEDLRKRHRVILYAPGQAYTLLLPIFYGSDVEVRPMEGLSFFYRTDGTLDYLRTILESFRKLIGFPSHLQAIRRQMLTDRPDLVITDFDPLLPKAAEQLGIPYISIDHQHFLTTLSLDALPAYMRMQAWVMGLAVRTFYGRQQRTVVSSFYHPPLRKAYQGKVDQVGVLLGQDILNLPTSDEGFLLVYLRRDTPRRVFRALRKCNLPVRIYGPETALPEGNLQFHSVSRAGFIQDLARCRAIMTTAGNQVVGEALHLGKPILAMPEPGNWEQGINGHFVESMGVGKCSSMRTLRSRTILRFLANLDLHRSAIANHNISGNTQVSRIVEEALLHPFSIPRRNWLRWLPTWPTPTMRARHTQGT